MKRTLGYSDCIIECIPAEPPSWFSKNLQDSPRAIIPTIEANKRSIYGSVDLTTIKEIKLKSMTPSRYNNIDQKLLHTEEMIIKTNNVTFEIRILIEGILTYFKIEIGEVRQDKKAICSLLIEKRGGKRKLKSIKI